MTFLGVKQFIDNVLALELLGGQLAQLLLGDGEAPVGGVPLYLQLRVGARLL